MGICSAKVQKSQTNSSRTVILTNNLIKCDNLPEQTRALKSDRSIQTNYWGNITPKSQGQLFGPQHQSQKLIKRTTWADQHIKNNQFCGALKNCISIKKGSFSRQYTIVRNSKVYHIVKLYKQMALVEHNLSGNLRIAQLANQSNYGSELVYGIVKYQLHHPNLQRIFEIFQDGNNYQIIHDYYAGEQLFQNNEQEPYSQQQAAVIIKQIIDVIFYLHQQELHHDYLTLQSFQKSNLPNSNYIKLTEFKSIFIKTIPNDQEYIYYQSPEAIKIDDCYSIENDTWSIGIILYKLLTGEYPFEGKNSHEIYQSITKYSLTGHLDLSLVPQECQHFIKSFLKINPKQRIKLNQALAHQWLQTNILESEEELNTIVNQLKNNKTLSFLQCCFLQFMISTLQQEQEYYLYQYFCLFDKNHDGRIDRKDLTQAFLKFDNNVQEVKEQVEAIFNRIDFNNSGGIDFQEFKIEMADKSQLLTDENLKLTFQLLTDKEGFITLSKMISLYPDEKEQLKIHYSIYEQNLMDEQEFYELMQDTK